MGQLRTYRPQGLKSCRNAASAALREGQLIIQKASPTYDDEVDAASAATDAIIGVVADGAIAVGAMGVYQNSGVALVFAGDAVAVGARVTSDAAGDGVTATAGQGWIGVAKTLGADGSLFEVDLDAKGAEMPGSEA